MNPPTAAEAREAPDAFLEWTQRNLPVRLLIGTNANEAQLTLYSLDQLADCWRSAIASAEQALADVDRLERHPYKTYRNEAGETVYDAPHEAREEFTLHIKTDGVFWSVGCDQEPGIGLCGTDLTKLLADFERSAVTIRKLNAEAAPKPSYEGQNVSTKAEAPAPKIGTPPRSEYRPCAICGLGPARGIHSPILNGPRKGEPWGHAYAAIDAARAQPAQGKEKTDD